MITCKFIVFTLLVFFWPVLAQAQIFEVFNPQVQQGGVIIIRITPQWLPPETFNPAIYVFGNHYLPNKNGEIFVGVGVDIEPGKYNITLVEYGRDVSLSRDVIEIEILERDFGKPWFRKLPKRNPKVEAQRKVERQIKENAYNLANHSEFYVQGKFIYPLDDVGVTDQFGTLRIYGTYNKKTKRWVPATGVNPVPHGGVDLRAKVGTPIRAINSGVVILAHHFPLRGTEGKMVVIDHGSGIVSKYLHLSEFKVKPGDRINKGGIIALSGATPKGTPQHLHFITEVNRVNVNPLVFISTINLYLRYS